MEITINEIHIFPIISKIIVQFVFSVSTHFLEFVNDISTQLWIENVSQLFFYISVFQFVLGPVLGVISRTF